MHAETQIQVGLLEWWNLAARGFGVDPRLASHCPNGGKRGIREAKLFKRMGVRAGTEDLFIAVPRGDKHGLFLELKAPGGRISPEQKEMMRLHQDQGYAIAVAYDFDEGVRYITNYLNRADPFRCK